MRKHLLSAVCVAALCGFAATTLPVAPAMAQSVSISFDVFHDRLASYGSWVYSDRWGEVWVPSGVSADFHPYGSNGHWAYTAEYGWTWASDYEWGDIPFHYGRWVNDPDTGWVWIPGYVWGPGWVVWRSGGQNTGWMPMPPDQQFLGAGGGGAVSVGVGGVGVSVDFGNTSGFYGYGNWYGPSYTEQAFAANWVFIGTAHMADPDYRAYYVAPAQNVTIIRQTTNITNYTVVNNYVVNKSVDVNVVERASGRTIQPVKIASVIKHPEFVVRADVGRQIQTRQRQENPRGNGSANSAPKPSQKVVDSLSTNYTPKNGHAAAHVYTKETVSNAPLKGSATTETGAKTPPENGTRGNENMEHRENTTTPEGNRPENKTMEDHRTTTTSGEPTPSTDNTKAMEDHRATTTPGETTPNTDNRSMEERRTTTTPGETTPNSDNRMENRTTTGGTTSNTDNRSMEDRRTTTTPGETPPGPDKPSMEERRTTTTPGETTPKTENTKTMEERHTTTKPSTTSTPKTDEKPKKDQKPKPDDDTGRPQQ